MNYYKGNEAAAAYLHVTARKISMYRRHGLITAFRGGHGWVYSQDELDKFMKEWQGYSLRNPDEIMAAKRMKNNGIAGDLERIHGYEA